MYQVLHFDFRSHGLLIHDRLARSVQHPCAYVSDLHASDCSNVAESGGYAPTYSRDRVRAALAAIHLVPEIGPLRHERRGGLFQMPHPPLLLRQQRAPLRLHLQRGIACSTQHAMGTDDMQHAPLSVHLQRAHTPTRDVRLASA
jgi:hypothetical protein